MISGSGRLSYPARLTRPWHSNAFGPFGWGPGVLFRYVNGDPLIPGTTFTRADSTTCATYVDSSGTVQTVAANVLRASHYVNGVRTTLLEGSRQNLCLQNRDLTQAGSWTLTNVTAAKDQTGADGVANSASSIVATAGNGTALQAITDGNAARFQSAWVKRITGSGTINMTMDNGATWTAITVTSAWTRVTIPTQTTTNPTVGFQIVTNGDKIAVDYVQMERGAFQSSSIATGASAVTRAADALSFLFAPVPQAQTFYIDFIESGDITSGLNLVPGIVGGTGAANPMFYFAENGAGKYNLVFHNGSTSKTSTPATSPSFGNEVELRGVLNGDGSVLIGQSINAGAEGLGSTSATQSIPATWAANTITLDGVSATSFIAIKSVKVLAGVQSLQTCRAA